MYDNVPSITDVLRIECQRIDVCKLFNMVLDSLSGEEINTKEFMSLMNNMGYALKDGEVVDVFRGTSEDLIKRAKRLLAGK